MPSCPVVIVAGTNSGVGKTSVAIALLHALRRRGLRAQPFKTGPDFLDPTLLAASAGRGCYNLDSWMMGREYILGLVDKGTAGADFAVVEGVMGLYDGVGNSQPAAGSTAELAMILSAPVLLVLDASGMAQSIAAVVKGYCELVPEVKVAGVIANRVGSSRHAQILSSALESGGLPPLLGAIPKGAFPELPRRHLGLVMAGPENLSDDILIKFSDAIEKYVSVVAVMASVINSSSAHEHEAAPTPAPPAPARRERKPRIGLAWDDVFSFYYNDELDLMEAGAELVKFSPMNDDRLPPRLDAIYFGGGYPEEHSAKLAENAKMLGAVREFAENGGKIYAECGGLIYLSKGVELPDGTRREFVGVVPSWTRMNKKLKSLGYVEVLLREDSLVGPAGARLRGHRFHYSELVEPPTEKDGWSLAYEVRNGRSDAVTLEGYKKKNMLASYVHLHLAGNINHFLRRCGGGI